ncbi:MAG: aminotransferase class III-fold pyridoxal phosphate-dependent enzyme [Methylotenera sp.]|nr:aminotransferase class III-fold pyridoxal phosphate-dependent enzyme [Oligoflexia bacterium]
MTQSHSLLKSANFSNAKAALLKELISGSEKVSGIRPSTPETQEAYLKQIQTLGKDKGRESYYPYLASGLGSGPYVELMDGSVKMDLITGIGINFFGHSHPELISEMINGLGSDVMQGNLQPGYESQELIRAVLSKVGEKSRLKHGWLLCSGTMSNEIALKIIRQKKFPATKIFAFQDCFAGRSTAMQEITDNPKYREGQPTYGEVSYLPFYLPRLGLERSVELTVSHMQWEVDRHPGKFAGLMLEIVQGEGGFNSAPREYYVKLFEAAKKANLAIWADEIQTFGRTEQLFAYQMFGLEEYIDVVTIGKLLQACMTLYTEEFNPRPGLVAGTFSGSSVALKTGRRIVELLTEGGYYGKDGRIAKLSQRFMDHFKRMSEGSCKGIIGECRNIGGMVAFTPYSGTMDDIKKVLFKLFEAGVVAFYCGHGPYLIRLLPPLGVMTEKQVDEACAIIEKVLIASAPEVPTASGASAPVASVVMKGTQS